MSAVTACNLALDGCGVVILLLFLLPQFSYIYGKGVNRHKRRLLNDAAVIHLFGLLIRFGGSISRQVGTPISAQIAFSAIAAVLGIVSMFFAVFCIGCDENGDFRIPRGKAIPIGQIACAMLPPSVAACLMSFLPGLQFMGITWAIALHLIHSLIMIDSEKRLTETERRLDRTHAAQMAVQMQPHFIFNTLSAIESLCETDPAAAAESVENLSGYLRGNIDALTAEALIPFNTELRHIRQYVALELARADRPAHRGKRSQARSAHTSGRHWTCAAFHGGAGRLYPRHRQRQRSGQQRPDGYSEGKPRHWHRKHAKAARGVVQRQLTNLVRRDGNASGHSDPREEQKVDHVYIDCR